MKIDVLCWKCGARMIRKIPKVTGLAYKLECHNCGKFTDVHTTPKVQK